MMTTWRRGRMILNERLSEIALPDHLFIDSLKAEKPFRVSGTAVFLDRTPDATPHALVTQYQAQQSSSRTSYLAYNYH